MLEVGFTCLCVNDFLEFGLKEGMTFDGLVTIDEYGETTFSIFVPGDCPIRCVQSWFVNHFKIIK